MRQRSLGQWAAVAVVPVLLMQCAPKCTSSPPGPAPTTTSMSSTPAPSTALASTSTSSSSSTTTSTATTASTTPSTLPPTTISVRHESIPGYEAQQLTLDGRFLLLRARGGLFRFDRQTGEVVAVPPSLLLTDDGLTVVSRTVGLTSHNIVTGEFFRYPPLPESWGMVAGNWGVTSASRDGRVIAVDAFGSESRRATFSFDRTAGVWSRPDAGLGDDGDAGGSSGQLLSSDGTVSAFVDRTGPAQCVGCSAVWVRRPSGLALASPSPSGGTPADGFVRLVDLSSDGRFVLFWSDSTDLAVGPASTASGQFYVHDLVSATTTRLDLRISPFLGDPSMSDDGMRIAFALEQTVMIDGFPRRRVTPALLDRTAGTTILLAPAGQPDFQLGPGVLVSADGAVVAFTESDPAKTDSTTFVATITGRDAPAPTTTSTTAPPTTAPPTTSPPAPPDVLYRTLPGWDIGGMTSSGRFLQLLDATASHRFDRLTDSLVALPAQGTLSGDGQTVVADDIGVISYDVASGRATTHPRIPDTWGEGGWGGSVTSISADASRIAVTASNGNLADTGTFTLDVPTGVWIRPDEPLGVAGMSNSSVGQLLSDDGSVSAFEYRDGPTGCQGCASIWVLTPEGLVFASPSESGGLPSGGSTRLVDLSSDGRLVLFWSTSTDIAGGPAGPNGSYYVRDIEAATTARLAIVTAAGAFGRPSISDDGTRVAFIGTRPIVIDGITQLRPAPALFDRDTGQTTILVPDDRPTLQLPAGASVFLSSDGRTVAYGHHGGVEVILADIGD